MGCVVTLMPVTVGGYLNAGHGGGVHLDVYLGILAAKRHREGIAALCHEPVILVNSLGGVAIRRGYGKVAIVYVNFLVVTVGIAGGDLLMEVSEVARAPSGVQLTPFLSAVVMSEMVLVVLLE